MLQIEAVATFLNAHVEVKVKVNVNTRAKDARVEGLDT